MPELPEVETVRRTLEELILKKKIERVTVLLPRIIQNPESPDSFCKKLEGTTISEIGRRGKYLKIYCKPWVLISHLRMEGKYVVKNQEDELEKHTHIIFHFTDGTELRYKDVRQFGTMDLRLLGREDRELPLGKLGVEPLSDHFSFGWFKETIKKRNMNTKAFLLNQEIIAGLGNIYADESLHAAKINPKRSTSSLNESEVHRLYTSVRKILKNALQAGGSSVRSYLDGQGEMGRFQLQIQVYGRKKEPCNECGNEIERMVVAGRGTYFCSYCQKDS